MKNLLLFLCFFMFSVSITTAQINEADSLAIVDLYYDLDGDNWTDNTNWLSSEPLNQWKGITIKNDRISEISLKNNNCVGSIGSSLSNCTALELLFLLENDIEGIAELDSFHQMKRINLSTNKLSDFPSFIYRCKNLEDLNLYDNAIEGIIPEALNNLTKLEELTLTQNQFEGELPALKDLKNLTIFEVSINYDLEGELSDILWDSLDLKTFDISRTKVSGHLKATYFDEDINLRIFADSSSISGIDQLQNFNISKIWMRNTDLGFDQLRSILAQNNIGDYFFNPQNDVAGTDPIEAALGGDITIPCLIEGAQSLQWYINNFPLTGETFEEFTITNIQMNNAGAYHCAGSHEDLPALLIKQEPTIVTVGTTSVMEEGEFSLKIFPNPASEFIRLEGIELFQNEYSIHNHVGQLMKVGTLVNNRIDIQELVPGKYTLVVAKPGSQLIKKSFIKI